MDSFSQKLGFRLAKDVSCHLATLTLSSLAKNVPMAVAVTGQWLILLSSCLGFSQLYMSTDLKM